MAEQLGADGPVTLGEAQKLIERAFERQVLEILGGNTLADLRVLVLAGDGADLPPAIAIICDSVGQIDLGWIEQTNVLSNTLFGSVAPVGWRAAAYRAVGKLAAALPLFDFEQMMEELSAYYWDGEMTDDGARHALVEYFGQDPEDLKLPSHIEALRPDFMLAENAAPMKALPPLLRAKLRRLSAAHDALKEHWREGNAWFFQHSELADYLPEYEDASSLPPMTTVPFDIFNEELDEVGRIGMEVGFLNLAGLCRLTDAGAVDRWFATLRLGAELIAAGQDLIDFNPAEVQR